MPDSRVVDIILGWSLFVFYAARAVFYTLVETASSGLNFLVQFVLGAGGRIFLALMIFSILGAVNTRKQREVDEKINNVYCETKPSRTLINNAIETVEPLFAPIICIYNLASHWSAVLVQVGLRYLWDCGDLKQFLLDLKDFIATVVETTIKFTFLDQGIFGNKFDFQAIFKAYSTLLTNADPVAVCMCEDLVPLYRYVRTIITDNNLGCTINQLINAVIQFNQEYFYTVLYIVQAFFSLIGPGTVTNPYTPGFAFMDTTCLAGQCAGSWIDVVLQDFIGFFVDNPPSLGVGCVIGELICVATSAIKILALNVVNLFWSPASWNPFLQSNFTDLIIHMNDTGKCVTNLLSPLDDCLGVAAGNFVRLASEALNFVVILIQQGKFRLDLVTAALNRFLGQSTFGPGSHVGLVGSHNKLNKMNQTAFTCLIARISQFTTASDPDFTRCNVAIADLTNSYFQVWLLPFDLVDEAVSNSGTLSQISGNPLSESSHVAFETYFNVILSSIVDRIFGLADYVGHLLGCAEPLRPFGHGIVVLVGNIRNVWNDIQDLIVLAIEFVMETVIVIITLFAGPIFGGDSFAKELTIFGRIFFDVLEKLLELLLDIVERIINFTIAFFFPALFGQSTLYANPNSPATFTACVSDFVPDCICGLTYQLAKDLCLPLDIGCLGDLWPGCGIFQTTPTDIVTSSNPTTETFTSTQSRRKRSTHTWNDKELLDGNDYYNTPFEYFAGEFNEGFCGDVFQRYKNHGRQDGTVDPKVGEIDVAIFLGCVGMVKSSVVYARDHNETVHPRYLMGSGRFFNTTKEFVHGATVASLTGIKNFAGFTRRPEPSIGKLSLRKPIYVSLEDDLRENNITDPLAVDYLHAVSDITSTGYNMVSDTINNGTAINQEGTIRKLFRLGELGKNLLAVTFTTGKIVASELSDNGVMSDITSGISTAASSWISTIDWNSVETVLSPENFGNRKRHHDEGIKAPWFPNVSADQITAEQDEARGISKAEIAAFYVTTARNAFNAYGGLLAGPYLEAMARRNMEEAEYQGMSLMQFGQPRIDIESGLYDTIAPYHQISARGFYGYDKNNRKRGVFRNNDPLNPGQDYPYLDIDQDNVHLNVSYIYGTNGLIDFMDHIPNSCGVVHMFCDGPLLNGCDGEMLVETLGLCQPFFGNRGVVMVCGDGFAGLAIYPDNACKGTPRIVTVNASIPGADRGCITFDVSPHGPINNFFCIRPGECQACPTDKVIPGFKCAYVDEVVHRMKYLTQRCLVLFIGAIKPPFNFSYIIPQPTDPFLFEFSGNRSTVWETIPVKSNTTCGQYSVCGDGILSTEVYRIYTNATSYVTRRCEECDDNNIRSNDGCSASCRLEKCPHIYTYTSTTNLGCDKAAIDATTPSVIIFTSPSECALGLDPNKEQSQQVNCLSHTPVWTYYADNSICIPPIDQTQLLYNTTCLDDCVAIGSGTCAGNVRYALSQELTCQNDCDVCGSGVFPPGSTKICDQDPYHGFTCYRCLFNALPCDPSVAVCTGRCRGGTTDGAICSAGPTTNANLPCIGGGTCMYQYRVCYDSLVTTPCPPLPPPPPPPPPPLTSYCLQINSNATCPATTFLTTLANETCNVCNIRSFGMFGNTILSHTFQVDCATNNIILYQGFACDSLSEAIPLPVCLGAVASLVSTPYQYEYFSDFCFGQGPPPAPPGPPPAIVEYCEYQVPSSSLNPTSEAQCLSDLSLFSRSQLSCNSACINFGGNFLLYGNPTHYLSGKVICATGNMSLYQTTNCAGAVSTVSLPMCGEKLGVSSTISDYIVFKLGHCSPPGSMVKRSIDQPATMVGGVLLQDYLLLLGQASQSMRHAENQYVKGKRDVMPGPQTQPEELYSNVRRQIVHPQLVSKDAWMATWYEDTFAKVLSFFSGGGNNTLDDKVQFLKDWFENTNISPYGEHGFWFYVTFPFICHNPENLDCSMGKGLPEGIVWSITYFLIVLLILSFVDFGLPTLFMSALMMIGLQIFLGVTVGYSLKCALSAPPRLPECIANETLRLTKVFNGTCIGFMQPVMQTPCTDACHQLPADCRDLGFIDGFDTVVAIVEFYLPPSASIWLRTSPTVAKIRSGVSLITWFNGYDLVASYDAALTNFNLMGGPATEEQIYCLWRTSPMIFEPLPFLFLTTFIALAFVKVYLVLAESVFWILYGLVLALRAMLAGTAVDVLAEQRLIDEEQHLRQQEYRPKQN